MPVVLCLEHVHLFYLSNLRCLHEVRKLEMETDMQFSKLLEVCTQHYFFLKQQGESQSVC